MKSKSLMTIVALMALAGPSPVLAQAQEYSPPSLLDPRGGLPGAPGAPGPAGAAGEPIRKIEISAGAQQLSDGYDDWRDLSLRGTYESGASVWHGELSGKKQFGESGTFLGLPNTVTLSPDWFAMVAAGAGDGVFYLPRVRFDASLSKKWLDRRNLVSTVGFGYYDAPDGHKDRAVNIGAVYYFEQPWIVEGGVRFVRSNPGGVTTHQQFVAATWGQDRRDLVTVRYGWGGEGYQAIAEDVTLVNFQSWEASVAWRHWIDRQSGFLLRAERYVNPNYNRSGIAIGWFHQF